jgi:hypothetical protein
MNNDINRIFDNIKASEELKERVYRKIENKRNYKKIFISLSLAVASLIFIFMLCNYNEKPMLSPTNYEEKRNAVDAAEKAVGETETFGTQDDDEKLSGTENTVLKSNNEKREGHIIYIVISGISGIIIGASIMYLIKEKKAY